MSDNPKREGGFWTSLPGVLAGLAAVVTAGTGLYLTLQQPSATAPTPNPIPRPAVGQDPTPPRFTGPLGSLERGISYSGGDIYDRPASSAEQCSELCANDDRCRAVTFIVSQQRCWVKDRINPSQQSGDMVSARKQD